MDAIDTGKHFRVDTDQTVTIELVHVAVVCSQNRAVESSTRRIDFSYDDGATMLIYASHSSEDPWRDEELPSDRKALVHE